MRRTNIYLDDDQLSALKHLAVEEQQSLAVLVRRAVDQYLAHRFGERGDWGERFDALIHRIQSRIPTELTPEQIEADISEARAEARATRQVRRLRTSARGR